MIIIVIIIIIITVVVIVIIIVVVAVVVVVSSSSSSSIMIVNVPIELQQLSCCCWKSEASNLNWICIFVDCFFHFFLLLGHPSWWWNLGAGSTGNCRRGWQYFAQPAVQLSSVDRSDWSRFQQKWPTVHWWISGNCFSKQCPTSKFKKNNNFSACMVLIENSTMW